MIFPGSACRMIALLAQESERMLIQTRLDASKTQAERNRLGQFATPAALAQDIVRHGVQLLGTRRPIRFLDPAFGTGSFFSALLQSVPLQRIESAKGFELDPYYGKPAHRLWQDTLLDLQIADFTKVDHPIEDKDRSNLLICNPPYVRHHHIATGEKTRLQDITESAYGIRIAGLAGLYCYFLGLSHAWMQQGGIAGWLIPSEFMDVNYGKAVKRYLLEKVTLLRIHRFDPNDVQFDDALVSSAVVWLRNDPPRVDGEVEFTFGGSLSEPKITRSVPITALRKETKWTRFPASNVRDGIVRYRLSDLFTIKRGIATGANKFFILTRDEIQHRDLPLEVFRPILPSPRFVLTNEIESDLEGLPLLDRQLFLLDCRLSESEIKERFPRLWAYLETGKDALAERYLCRTRKAWYFQEERPPAPILCTYLGRGDTKSGQPFRFFLNHSRATAANVYLLLYPKPVLARVIARDRSLIRHIWEALNDLCPSSVLAEGRVYGGGLHKLEPKELGNIDAAPILEAVSGLQIEARSIQPSLFDPNPM
jgi:adenine-specific DNA-methyltransferase